VILTGTPSGWGPLKPGDQVEVSIPGLGTLAHSVEADNRLKRNRRRLHLERCLRNLNKRYTSA